MEFQTSPPEYIKWLDEEKSRINNLKSKHLTISDIALGRFRSEKKRELEKTFKSMEQQESDEILIKIQDCSN